MWRYLLIVLLFFLIFSNNKVFAQSSYVLPYPSAMPGSIFYKLDVIQEYLLSFWYYGDFNKFEYNLKESDKYLVEAKTLFDYKQYLLAFQALKKSDSYFKNAPDALVRAKSHGKDISDKEVVLKNAAEKHIEELKKIKSGVPEVFIWTPEKTTSTNLNLWSSIEDSIRIRNEVL